MKRRRHYCKYYFGKICIKIQKQDFKKNKTCQLFGALQQNFRGLDATSLRERRDSLWGRRLGPGPYDGSKPLLSLPALSCSPAAFSVGNSSWEKGCSRFEALEPDDDKESSELHTPWQIWATRRRLRWAKACVPSGDGLMLETRCSMSQAGQMTHHPARLPFHLAGPIVLVHLCSCSEKKIYQKPRSQTECTKVWQT